MAQGGRDAETEGLRDGETEDGEGQGSGIRSQESGAEDGKTEDGGQRAASNEPSARICMMGGWGRMMGMWWR